MLLSCLLAISISPLTAVPSCIKAIHTHSLCLYRYYLCFTPLVLLYYTSSSSSHSIHSDPHFYSQSRFDLIHVSLCLTLSVSVAFDSRSSSQVLLCSDLWLCLLAAIEFSFL